MEREKARKQKEIIPVSHLRHTSDKACNVKASPNKGVQPTAYSVRSSVAPASSGG
jgi:hypothetical protein